MKYLKIQNNGELDIRLVALMGGTTKSKDEFKIGQWGSGLKYTLAYLLKNNLDFKIFIGGNEVKVTTETENIRDEKFEIICIDGKRTSITTQMGGDAWKAWMIVRELWCNALDEGGEIKDIVEDCCGSPGTTTFYIQLSTEIKEVWDNWSKYFIQGVEPMSDKGFYKIYPGGQSLRFYKNGVLIMERPESKSLFSYDIGYADINELREFRGSVEYPIADALSNASPKVIEYFLENISEKYVEGDMDYTSFVTFAKEWKDALGGAKLIHKEIIENMAGRGIEADTQALICVPKCVYQHLTKQFPGIGALRLANKVNEFYEIYDADCEVKIKSALAILETCGYFIHPELKFVYGAFGDKRVIAQIHLDTKEIMISECIKNRSTFDVVATIVEENEHFQTGFNDHTREFQQHFINLYTKTLLDKNNVPV